MLFMSCVCHALCLFIAALWSPGEGLTSWLSFVMFYCVFVSFPCGILGQVWCLIVSIPDLCHLSYFVKVDLDPLWQNFLDSRMFMMSVLTLSAGTEFK